MRLRIGVLALGVVLGAAVLISGAGASTQRVAIPTSVSSNALIARYLVSVGVDPSGFVIQRGAHNYAGSNCPGRGWTCTTATRVLQIAAGSKGTRDDGNPGNTFQCTASSGGWSSAPNDCTIVQVAAGGDNTASCVEGSAYASVTQTCLITQSNTTGANRLEISQQVDAKGGAKQDASQFAGSAQVNGSGPNFATIGQDLKQVTRDTDASGAQTQNGHQSASVTQSSDTGANTTHVHQTLALNAKAGGATVSQSQNADGSGGPNANAGITQDSSTGRNAARLNQSNDLDGTVSPTSNGSQTQGSPSGGINGYLSQDSAGVSTVTVNQRENQFLKVGGDPPEKGLADRLGKKPPPPPGVVTQTQYGPVWADPDQGSNPADSYTISQSSAQNASSPTLQDDRVYGQCNTSGNCTIDERIQQQGQGSTNACAGQSCNVGLISTATGGESSTSTCNGSESESNCPSPPPPPQPPSRPPGGGE